MVPLLICTSGLRIANGLTSLKSRFYQDVIDDEAVRGFVERTA